MCYRACYNMEDSLLNKYCYICVVMISSIKNIILQGMWEAEQVICCYTGQWARQAQGATRGLLCKDIKFLYLGCQKNLFGTSVESTQQILNPTSVRSPITPLHFSKDAGKNFKKYMFQDLTWLHYKHNFKLCFRVWLHNVRETSFKVNCYF